MFGNFEKWRGTGYFILATAYSHIHVSLGSTLVEMVSYKSLYIMCVNKFLFRLSISHILSREGWVASRIVIQCIGSRSFRPMSFSPGVVSPGPRVDSPGVWSRFARELRISLFLLEISENHKNQVKFKIFSDRWMDNWVATKLFVIQIPLINV